MSGIAFFLGRPRAATTKTISGISKDTAEANTRSADPVDLSERDLGLGPVRPQLLWNTARSRRTASLVQLSGRNRWNPTITGTSPDASITATSVWQLAFFPSAEAFCGATPTECLPIFDKAASSMISQASPPPPAPRPQLGVERESSRRGLHLFRSRSGFTPRILMSLASRQFTASYCCSALVHSRHHCAADMDGLRHWHRSMNGERSHDVSLTSRPLLPLP